MSDKNHVLLPTCLIPLVMCQPRAISSNSNERQMGASIGRPQLSETSSRRVASTNRKKVFVNTTQTSRPLTVPYCARLGRYHLYVSYGCPWASRTLIVRKLKGLEDVITVSIVSPRMDSNGWPFARVDPFPGAEDDPIYNARYLKDIYLSVEPHYQGRWVDHFPTPVCSWLYSPH